MRYLAGLLLVLLVALMITSMPSFKGLSVIQLDRLNELLVGTDPGGALGITGLDEGTGGAIPIGSETGDADRLMGTITNNFDIDIQFDVTVEVKATVFEPTGPPQKWQDINIFFEKNEVIVEELEFQDITEPQEPGQELTVTEVVLSPGETLVVLLDQESHILQPGLLTVDNFQGLALFSITGGSTGNENITFNLEPAGDLRKQYFGDDEEEEEEEETTGVSYPDEELEDTDNLTGDIDYLGYDPDSDAAGEDWYEAENFELDTELHVKLEAPESGTLVGTQTLKILVRRTNNPPPGGSPNAAIPSLDVELHQDGEDITLVSGQEVIVPEIGQVLIFYFEANELTDLTGADLEVWMHGNHGSAGYTHNTVEFGAIEWGYRTE